VALNLELWRAEATRPSQHPDAADYIFRAGAILIGGPASRERYAEAIALFEHALALDPQSVDAQSGLAVDLASRVTDNMTDTAAADLARAESLAGQALTAASNSSLAHYAKGQLLRAQSRYAEAIPKYEAALSYNPNWVHALHALARCKFFTGSMEEVIPLEEQAIRLSPRDAGIGGWYRQMGSFIWRNHGQTRRSSGSKRRAAALRHIRISALTSLPPTPLLATPSAPPPNSPRPAG
jgi:tetratricopeptide (TPR) repeat protein